MAFPFLDTLFNKDASVRLPVRDGNIYRLEESLGLDCTSSYVDLYLPNGFVVKNDENFRVKNIFNKGTKGFTSKNDFIVVEYYDGEVINSKRVYHNDDTVMVSGISGKSVKC